MLDYQIRGGGVGSLECGFGGSTFTGETSVREARANEAGDFFELILLDNSIETCYSEHDNGGSSWGAGQRHLL